MVTQLGKYADVNGIKLYCEIHGEGKPLILLHGGLGAIEILERTSLPSLRTKSHSGRFTGRMDVHMTSIVLSVTS